MVPLLNSSILYVYNQYKTAFSQRYVFKQTNWYLLQILSVTIYQLWIL